MPRSARMSGNTLPTPTVLTHLGLEQSGHRQHFRSSRSALVNRVLCWSSGDGLMLCVIVFIKKTQVESDQAQASLRFLVEEA